MSNEYKNPDEGTALHLSKFAPGAVLPVQPDPETGLTVTIRTAAAERMQQHSGAPVVRTDGGLPAKEMLGAVSYCYAKGVYTSEEIERKMMHDETLRESVHGEVPNAQAIRRFRRLNRGAIQETLEKAFSFLCRKKKASSAEQALPEKPASPQPGLLEESTVGVGRRQAEERVQQAAFIDNMSKD